MNVLRAVPKDPDRAQFRPAGYACDDRPYLCYRCRMASCWAGIPAMFRGVTIRSLTDELATGRLMEQIR